MAKFMTKSGGSWSCSVCMISNSSDKSKCAACETPKPGEEKPVEVPAAPKTDDLMAKFMTKSGGNWSCSVCMISNSGDKAKCAACETPKPGVEKPGDSQPAKPTFNFGSGGGFKFVDANASSAKTETPFSSFKFGGSEPDAAASASNGGGFKFGASEPAAAPAPEGGIKFGLFADSPPAIAPASGFSFGSGGIVATPGKGGFTFSSTKKVGRSNRWHFCNKRL